MIRTLIHRLLLSIPVLAGVILLSFIMLALVPSDPAAFLAGEHATPAMVEEIRRRLGSDLPIYDQFVFYLKMMVLEGGGRSIYTRISVWEDIARSIGPTFELAFAAVAFAIPVGMTLGVLAATRRGKLLDRVVMAISVVGASTPIFMTGLLLVSFFSIKLGWLPTSGRAGPFWTLEGLRSITMPAVTLGAVLIGPIARMVRTTVVEMMNQDFIKLARAKGLTEWRVVIFHALRNSLVPTITLIGLQIGHLLTGAVVTETIFAWPGVGRLAVNSIGTRDTPVVMGAMLGMAIVFLTVNLIVDLLCAYLDPRVRARA